MREMAGCAASKVLPVLVILIISISTSDISSRRLVVGGRYLGLHSRLEVIYIIYLRRMV